MKKTHESCINALNDLVQINNDRIVGYGKAIDELKDGQDGDLKSLFSSMIADSEKYKSELAAMISSYGGDVAQSSTVSGKIYRAWMDVKALFTGGDRETVLNNCKGGEEAAQKAYEMALNDDDVMQETKDLIAKQKTALQQSLSKISALATVA